MQYLIDQKRRCRCNDINIFEEDMGDRRILGKRWIKLKKIVSSKCG